LSSPTDHTIDRPREPNRHTHDAARQRNLVVGLDEQVDVIRLHGEMDDPKPRPRRLRERRANRRKHLLFAQTG
jgi:hypothetical protein